MIFVNKADFGIVVHRNRLENYVEVHVQKVKFRHLGEACLSIRQWADKPYRSTQVEIARLGKDDGVGIQKLTCEKIITDNKIEWL